MNIFYLIRIINFTLLKQDFAPGNTLIKWQNIKKNNDILNYSVQNYKFNSARIALKH